MRITCPNCNAHYDIDRAMIPAAGRDVQCSACGTTWFQEPRGEALVLPEPDVADEEDLAPDPSLAGMRVVDGTVPSPIQAMTRRPMADEATLEILRQERAREEALRARARGLSPRAVEAGPEAATAGDPGQDRPEEDDEATGDGPVPDDAPPLGEAARERAKLAAAAAVAHARADAEVGAPSPDIVEPAAPASVDMTAAEPVPPAAEPDGPAARAARRDLLPDIEEISSALSPEEHAAPPPEAPPEDEGEPALARGFRIGFGAVCATAVVGVLVYLYADAVISTVPALADPLAAYITGVDAARLSLEAGVENLLTRLAPEPSDA
jgi:predicted Zn finger-like uncharacterized protein